jgi:hypothetical protein
MLAINYTLTARQEAAITATTLRSNAELGQSFTPQQWLNRTLLDLLKNYVAQMETNLRAAAHAKIEAKDVDKMPAIEAAIDAVP